ncbi:MAG: 30S ribosomal protein S3ae [Nitrososphaeria archaeon]
MPKRAIKVKDKWKEKTWLQVEAPEIFGNKLVAQIPVTDVEKAVGRTVETTLFDLIGEDEEQHAIKLKLQIRDIQEKVAKTNFKQFELARETLKSLIRKGTSIVDFHKNIETKDGARLRIFGVIYTSTRINASKKKAIRKAANVIVEEKAGKLTFGQFVLESVLGKIASDIFNNSKKIVKIRYTSIRKLKVLSYPRKEEKELTASPS